MFDKVCQFIEEHNMETMGLQYIEVNLSAIQCSYNIVKFDRGMTLSYFENAKAKHIMDAAMTMIKGMNLAIVSEGIENAEQLKIMEALGIQYIQGYYFSKPLPENKFTEFIIAAIEKEQKGEEYE